MSRPDLLRPGLLANLRVLVVPGGEDGEAPARAVLARSAVGGDGELDPARFGSAAGAICAQLGARVGALRGQDEPAARLRVERVLGAGDVDMLVCDGQALYAVGAERGVPAVRRCADACWNALRAVATAAWIERGRGGRVVLVAPAPDGTPWAEASRAGLENAARTLSIEWARHSIMLMSIAPGEHTRAHEVGELVALLGSPAGAYFSGSQLDLRGP